MALENIFESAAAGDGRRGGPPSLRRRWAVTTVFGLVHGFGFSFALGEQLQFAGTHLLTSLLAFNVGVEIAQLVVIVAAASRRDARCSAALASPRVAAIVLSALAAHTGWDWLLERGAVLWQFPWPVPSAAAVWAAAIWLALAVSGGGGRVGRSQVRVERAALIPMQATESVR